MNRKFPATPPEEIPNAAYSGPGAAPGPYADEVQDMRYVGGGRFVRSDHTAESCPRLGCDFTAGGRPSDVLAAIEEHERWHQEMFTPAVVQLDRDDARQRMEAALTVWDDAYVAHTSGDQGTVSDVIHTFDAYQVAVRGLHDAVADYRKTVQS